jgi:hypothetical protein
VITLGVLFLLTASCRERQQSGVPVMHFTVTPSLLGPAVVADDLGIQFQPPVGWEPLSATAFDSLNQVLERPDDAVPLQPHYVFLDAATGSLCSVTTVHFVDKPAFDIVIDRYGQLLAAQFPEDALRRGLFDKDGIRIAQFLVQPEGRVVFKLLFEAAMGNVLQFDYIVPSAVYAAEVKTIESSIGSIQRLH